MGHLHRLYTRHAKEVWRKETELLAAAGLARPPVAVQWIVTSACDLSCPHCYSGAGRRRKDELTTQEAKHRVIDELAAMVAEDEGGATALPVLVLAGGELLLRRDIPELVAHATERGVPWAMHTHGAHVPKHRQWLERMPPRLAAISLDGDAEVHDGFRGRTGSHAAALDAVRLLREIGCPEVVIGTTVTRRNADALADLFPVVRDSGAHSWGLHLFAPEGRGAEHQALFPTDPQLQRVVAFARRARCMFHVELCNEWGGAGDDDLYYRDAPFACGAGRISLVIGAGGEVLPCTTTDVRESEGNVREYRLRDLWLRGFARFRRHGDDPCGDDQECWLQSRNGNGCRRRAFGTSAHGIRPSPSTPARPPSSSTDLRPTVRLRVSGSASTWRLGGPRALASARAIAIASLVAPGCTQPPEPVEPGDADLRPSSADTVTSTEGDRTWRLPADLSSALTQWPTPIDDEALRGLFFRRDRHGSEPLAGETIDQIESSLQALESDGVFGAGIVVHAWASIERRLASEPGPSVAERTSLVRLTARLRRHARVVDTMLRAEADTGPVEFTAWRSKAGPSERDLTLPAGLADAIRDRWPTAKAGSWETESCVELELRKGQAWRVRGGIAEPMKRHRPTELCRLDLLVVAPSSEVADCCLGALRIPPNTPTSPAELGDALSSIARAEVEALVERAITGDESALVPLQGQLAQSHRTIRAALARTPDAPGAPALRQVLWTWDR